MYTNGLPGPSRAQRTVPTVIETKTDLIADGDMSLVSLENEARQVPKREHTIYYMANMLAKTSDTGLVTIREDVASWTQNMGTYNINSLLRHDWNLFLSALLEWLQNAICERARLLGHHRPLSRDR
ncbi:hypothetical protein LTR10_000455 [Elasticomyces elasticus]|nr:hypothetical protein LTR10_000455 [Elasticomyces elasticus]KAK4980295.1 hypothetical protein LTR42_000602 [Elasticomyces elasticus]